MGKEGPRQRRLGTLINRLLETHFPTPFHTAGGLSAPSGHLPLEGKAGDTRIAASQKIFGHRLIYICGEAATTTLNPWKRQLLFLYDEFIIMDAKLC